MLVMKFGGASVQKPENFQQIAEIIALRMEVHAQIVVVVSAMQGMTDQLLELAGQVNANPPKRELDMLISVGERISISLLAMALALKGKEAVSFTGSQSGIITCANHTDAKIMDVRPYRLMPVLNQGQVAIVAGFQGVSSKGEITTLGRGGSDTTAVALAVALGSEKVEFYKDVPGIFTADPKRHKTAQKHANLSYAEALLLAQGGAKVLHPRAIALAARNGIQLSVRSFLEPQEEGTLVGSVGRVQSKMYEMIGS